MLVSHDTIINNVFLRTITFSQDIYLRTTNTKMIDQLQFFKPILPIKCM